MPYPDGAPAGSITDDTQMTLFTAEGLLRAGTPITMSAVHASYDEWLTTQYTAAPPGPVDGNLRNEPWLYVRRAPGHTCLDALTTARAGGDRIQRYGEVARNDSKGCGGVMRVAPIGLLPASTGVDWIFDAAALAAAFTHGHVTGQFASGALATIVHGLVRGDDLDTALDSALQQLARRNDYETLTALRAARDLARGYAEQRRSGRVARRRLGRGGGAGDRGVRRTALPPRGAGPGAGRAVARGHPLR